MQVVEMLLRNLVAGNLAASCVMYWLISEHRGMLHKLCSQGTTSQNEYKIAVD